MVDSITSLDFFPLRCLCRSHSVHSLVPGHVPLMAVVFLSSLVQNGTWNHWSVIVCVCVCVCVCVYVCVHVRALVHVCLYALYVCMLVFFVFSRVRMCLALMSCYLSTSLFASVYGIHVKQFCID